MAKASQSGKSNLKRLLLLALILLIVAAAVNAKTIMQIARGERTLKGVIYGMAEGRQSIQFAGWQVPPDSGAKDAKVVIEVFARGGEGCHVQTAFLGQALGTVDPKRIRVTFRDTSTPEAMKRFQQIKLGCEQGIAINGKVKFSLPSTDPQKKQRVVYLAGGHEQHWTMEDLHAILNKELKQAYGGKGLTMDAKQFADTVSAAQKALLDELRQRAASGKSQGKAGGSPTAPPPAPVKGLGAGKMGPGPGGPAIIAPQGPPAATVRAPTNTEAPAGN